MSARPRTSYGPLAAAWLGCALVVAGCGRLDPEAELAVAAASVAAGNYGEAAIRLNNVVQVQPDNVEARRLRGELALVLGEYAEAAQELERARVLGAPFDSIVLGLADATASLGRADEALALLDSAAATHAGDPLYWTIRAEALARAERLDEAEQALAAGERAGDGGARAQLARAAVSFARNDPAAAHDLLDRAIGARPDDASLLAARGELLARTSRLTEAAVDLLRSADLYRAASLSMREAAILSALVQVHLARNDLDAAEATAARLEQLAPTAASTAYLQALVEYRRGRFDEAAALIQPIVNDAPNAAQFRSLLGAIHLARGNLGQAEQQFQTVLVKSPRDPAAIKLLAETHLRQQRPEAALATLRAVEEAATEDAQIGLLRGLASLMSGNLEQGLLYLEQAASLDPTNQLLKLQLARAYLAAGRDADAAGLLRDSFAGGSTPLEASLLQLFADIRLGTPDSAAATQLIAEFPREPRALTAVAIYSQLRGDNRRARELFEQAGELETSGATARLFVAAALVQEGRRQEAEQLLTKVVAEQPANAQALTALAELLAARGAYDEAARLLERVIAQSPATAQRLPLAQLRIRQGDFAAAKLQLDAAATVAPDNPEVIAVRGLLAFSEGRAGEAVSLLRRAEAELPNRLGVSLALARAQLASGQADAARTNLRRLLALAPRSLPVRLVLGDAELKLGNAAEALSIAAALKADYPALSGGYLLEANAQIATRRYAAAADTLTTAFDRDPTWPVLARLVAVLQLAGRPDEALRATEAWVAANPRHVAGTLMVAGLLQDARRYDESLRAYEATLSLDDDNVVALNNAAWLSQQLAKPGALALAERAYALAPDNAAVLDTLGWILVGEKRERDAIGHLSKASQLAPQVPEIRYHFAKALVALGRSVEARSVLTPLLAEGRDFEDRAEARRLLDSL
jgi:putative PEP-CTERM system TPR-repeat lipoprotein